MINNLLYKYLEYHKNKKKDNHNNSNSHNNHSFNLFHSCLFFNLLSNIINISTLIISIIYIDKFCDKNDYYLTQNNIFRILLSVCILSLKFNEDITVNYKNYSEIAAVSVEDLKNLEFYMYLKLHFSLKVEYDLYKSYYDYFSNYSLPKKLVSLLTII